MCINTNIYITTNIRTNFNTLTLRTNSHVPTQVMIH